MVELVNDKQDTIEHINIFSSNLLLNNGDFYKIKEKQLLARHVARFFPAQNHPGPAGYPGSMCVHITQLKQVCKKIARAPHSPKHFTNQVLSKIFFCLFHPIYQTDKYIHQFWDHIVSKWSSISIIYHI